MWVPAIKCPISLIHPHFLITFNKKCNKLTQSSLFTNLDTVRSMQLLIRFKNRSNMANICFAEFWVVILSLNYPGLCSFVLDGRERKGTEGKGRKRKGRKRKETEGKGTEGKGRGMKRILKWELREIGWIDKLKYVILSIMKETIRTFKSTLKTFFQTYSQILYNYILQTCTVVFILIFRDFAWSRNKHNIF